MIIGHNMDFYNKMADTLYVVCAHILPYKSRAGREFPEEKFVSMQYTGSNHVDLCWEGGACI